MKPAQARLFFCWVILMIVSCETNDDLNDEDFDYRTPYEGKFVFSSYTYTWDWEICTNYSDTV